MVLVSGRDVDSICRSIDFICDGVHSNWSFSASFLLPFSYEQVVAIQEFVATFLRIPSAATAGLIQIEVRMPGNPHTVTAYIGRVE